MFSSSYPSLFSSRAIADVLGRKACQVPKALQGPKAPRVPGANRARRAHPAGRWFSFATTTVTLWARPIRFIRAPSPFGERSA